MRVRSIAGSPSAASDSRVDRPAGMAARLFWTSLPCFFRCSPTMASTPALVGVEVATGGEVLGQGPGLVAGPGLEGGDELDLVDQAVLQGEQAEEQVVVGGDGGHGAGLPGCRHGRWAFSPDVGGLRPRGCGSVGLSHAGSAHAAPPRPLGTTRGPCRCWRRLRWVSDKVAADRRACSGWSRLRYRPRGHWRGRGSGFSRPSTLGSDGSLGRSKGRRHGRLNNSWLR